MAGDVADLDVVRAELRRGVEQEPADAIRLAAPPVVLVEEPVHEELDLEVSQPVVVEAALQLCQGLRLEQVLEVRVPDPEPAEAGRARRRAAVGPAEEAPLAADVHLDRARNGPVEPDEVRGHECGRYSLRTISAYGAGPTVARISVCTCRSTTGFCEPPSSSPHTSTTSSPMATSEATIASESIELSFEL